MKVSMNKVGTIMRAERGDKRTRKTRGSNTDANATPTAIWTFKDIDTNCYELLNMALLVRRVSAWRTKGRWRSRMRWTREVSAGSGATVRVSRNRTFFFASKRPLSDHPPASVVVVHIATFEMSASSTVLSTSEGFVCGGLAACTAV